MYEHEWTVRFSDTDPYGIAYYPDIVDAIHDVADRFMEAIGFPFWEISSDHGYGLPIIEFHVEFEQPIRAGDTVRIQLRPELGNTSVRFEYEAIGPDQTVVFSAYEQRACVPVDGDRSEPVPDDLRDAMAPYLAG